MYNPLAIGVTLGGLLLDVVVPRPKPRVGPPLETTLLSERPGARTARHASGDRARSSAVGRR
jgi:hypothetical protein